MTRNPAEVAARRDRPRAEFPTSLSWAPLAALEAVPTHRNKSATQRRNATDAEGKRASMDAQRAVA